MNDLEKQAYQIMKHALAAAKAAAEEDAQQEPEITIELKNRQASIEYRRGNITVEKDALMSRLEREIDDEYRRSSAGDAEEYIKEEARSLNSGESPLTSKEEETGNGKPSTKDRILNS